MSEAGDGQEPYEQIVAVVRIRIAKRKPEQVEEGEEEEKPREEPKPEELEEMPIDDKAWSITTYNEGTSIYVIN